MMRFIYGVYVTNMHMLYVDSFRCNVFTLLRRLFCYGEELLMIQVSDEHSALFMLKNCLTKLGTKSCIHLLSCPRERKVIILRFRQRIA